jgi:NAD(P)-dependent dehydrogenase (short-subunit alcohol dehydrogenase family)
MWNNFNGRAVVITGGTRGIGLATGLAFGSRGANVTLTHKWASADEASINDAFAKAGAPAPRIIQADAGSEDDVMAVMEALRRDHDRIEVFVSNAAFGATVRGIDDYSKKALHAGIDYSAWPLVTHTMAARKVFGKGPRYVVGISSEGADSMHAGYDLIATAKATLETLCRYLHYRLSPDGTTVNVVRTRFVDTESLASTFGEEFADFVRKFEPDVLTPPGLVADAVVGICSGLMDALGGQVVTVDRGAGLYENFSRLYQERHIHSLATRRQP